MYKHRIYVERQFVDTPALFWNIPNDYYNNQDKYMSYTVAFKFLNRDKEQTITVYVTVCSNEVTQVSQEMPSGLEGSELSLMKLSLVVPVLKRENNKMYIECARRYPSLSSSVVVEVAKLQQKITSAEAESNRLNRRLHTVHLKAETDIARLNEILTENGVIVNRQVACQVDSSKVACQADSSKVACQVACQADSSKVDRQVACQADSSKVDRQVACQADSSKVDNKTT